ncbi:MAG: serine hydrolase [Bacteroidales bacterium]|nr:serine hydrolase [Bacteroidales bacterium]
MKKLVLFAAAILALVSSCAPKNAPKFDMSRMALADSVIEKAIVDSIIPGAVLCVVRGDEVVYKKAYGYKQLIPEAVPMTTETVFDLASLSKCIGTTLSFMTLIEDGKVKLDDDVDRYIPGFAPYVDPETGKKDWITIQDILTHSSGLSAYTNVAKCVERFGENCPDSLMWHIATEIPRNFKPGTRFLYSCLNFVTVQNVLQNITGEKLCDYAQRRVFDRLGLKHTCYLPLDREIPADLLPLIAPTEVQADGLPYLGQVHDPIANKLNWGNSGNAGVFSNVDDLAIVAMALMNGGEYNGKRLMSPGTVKMMCTVPSDNDPSVGRALGWDMQSSHMGIQGSIMSQTNTIGHTGYTGTSMVLDFDTNTAVILLTNRVHPYDTGSLYRTRHTVANIVASCILD